MSHPSKRKGTGYERELVNEAKERGLTAERAYASNGRALGCAEEVDLVVSGCRMQAKRRKRIPAVFSIPGGADAAVFREDGGDSFVLLKWSDFLDVLVEKGGW